MKPIRTGGFAFRGKVWLVKLALLAAGLGLSSWAFLHIMMRLKPPEGFPVPPDQQSLNPELRKLLGSADAEARSHPNSAEAVGHLGMVYHSNQLYEQAASSYAIAARIAPGEFRWSYLEALLREENGDEAESQRLLEKTVRLRSDYIPAAVKLADLFLKQDKLDQAANYYGRITEQAAGNPIPQAVFGLGRVAARRQDWRTAVRHLAPLVREYPLFRPPHQLLADAYRAIGDDEKAAAEMRTLLRADLTAVPPPHDPLGEDLLDLCCIATTLLKQAGFVSRFGDSDRSLRLARRAVEVEPDDPDARHFLSRSLLKSRGSDPKAVEEALGHLREGLRLRPGDLRPLLIVADIFFSQNKTDASIEQLRSMLARSANGAEAHYYLGIATQSQGKLPEAIGHYRDALRDDPKYAEPYHRLGLILVQNGNPMQGIEYLQKAVRLKPAFTLAHFNLGRALEQQGKTPEAIARYSEVLRLEPNHAAAHLNLGLLLAQLGQFGEAERHFRESVRIMPNDPEAHYDLGCVLASLGKGREAAEELRRTLILQPGNEEASARLQEIERKKP